MVYDFEYLGSRQIDLEGRDYADVDDCFRELQEIFSIEWLEGKKGNVIQQLWQSPYPLATSELYALGFAIRALINIDPTFVKDKVTCIKSDDPRNWNGALFELFALHLFKACYQVVPAKENQPGYDGIIHMGDGKAIRLSVKNYSISRHQEAYMDQCNRLSELTKTYIQQFGCVPLEVIIHKQGESPNSRDWEALFQNFHGCFIDYNQIGKHFSRFTIEDWSITLQELIPPEGTLSKAVKSYTLIISAPFHKNEEKNLFDKLEEACANLSKHEQVETGSVKNFIIVHLPDIASRSSCEQWVQQYFEQYPHKPISGVILLQPLVLRSEEEPDGYISMGVSAVLREQAREDYQPLLPILLTPPVGKLESVFPQHKISIRQTTTTAIEVILADCYIFQKGDHYYASTIKESGEQVGEVDKVASGIRKHLIIDIMGQPVALSGQIEPIDKLLIL